MAGSLAETTPFLSHFPRFCRYSDSAKKQHLTTAPPMKTVGWSGTRRRLGRRSGAGGCLCGTDSGAFLRRSGCVSWHMHHLTGKPGIATGHDPQTPRKPEKRTLPPALCPYQQLYTTYQPRQAPVSQLSVGVGLHSWVSVVLWWATTPVRRNTTYQGLLPGYCSRYRLSPYQGSVHLPLY